MRGDHTLFTTAEGIERASDEEGKQAVVLEAEVVERGVERERDGDVQDRE